MTFHDHMAGANSVRAFLNGFPRLRTNADFRAGFRAEAETAIEELIAALDAIDGDADDEASEADEASLSLGEWNGNETHGHQDEQHFGRGRNVLSFYGYRDVEELEQDGGDMCEEDAGDNGEPAEDREPILGWAETVDQRFSVERMGDTDTYDEEEAG